jgi:hypothetical protein
MKRGRVTIEPIPSFWLDANVLLGDMDNVKKLIFKVVSNTCFFEKVAQKLPIKKDILLWIGRNFQYAIDLVVVGTGFGPLDQLLRHRLEDTWVREVYWAPNIQTVIDEMKKELALVGFLTERKEWLSEPNNIFLYEGPTMRLDKSLRFYQQNG